MPERALRAMRTDNDHLHHYDLGTDNDSPPLWLGHTPPPWLGAHFLHEPDTVHGLHKYWAGGLGAFSQPNSSLDPKWKGNMNQVVLTD